MLLHIDKSKRMKGNNINVWTISMSGRPSITCESRRETGSEQEREKKKGQHGQGRTFIAM
jgi:hypothetical protein